MDHFITNPTTDLVTEIQDFFNWSIRTTHGTFRAQSYQAEERSLLWVRVEAAEEPEATEQRA